MLHLATSVAISLAAIVALGAVVALFWRLGRFEGVAKSKGTLGWVLVFAVLLGALAVLLVAGPVDVGRLEILLFSLTMLLCGVLVLARDAFFAALRAKQGEAGWLPQRGWWHAVALLGCTFFGVLALELPCNSRGMPSEPVGMALELVFVLVFLAVLYLLFQRRGMGIAVGLVALFLLGVAQHFVLEFRGMPMMLGDILAAGTAAEVAGGYVYAITPGIVQGAACLGLGVAIASFVAPARAQGPRGVALRAVGTVACAALLVAAGALAFSNVRMGRTFGVWADHWNATGMVEGYESFGYLPQTVNYAQGMFNSRPEGYSEQEAAALQEQLASQGASILDGMPATAKRQKQFADLQPHVVVVMNESFSDLSIFDELKAGYEGPRYFKSGIPSPLARGQLCVSVRGGGTANTEFEFLTGASLGFLGKGTHPYVLCDLTDLPSLPSQFAAMGYQTTAMHPNLASNWYRDKVYDQLDFDQFLDISDFPADAPVLHAGVTDAATYDKVMEVLEGASAPQFIFDVTMQNHGGYTTQDIPADLLTDYHPADPAVSSGDDELNGFLSCMEASDADLRYLIERLEAFDEPVVLLFFGDHQPGFTELYNEAWHDEEEEGLAYQQRTYTSDFVLWANYDVEATIGADGAVATDEGILTSPSFLAPLVGKYVGMPPTSLQQVDYAFMQQVPALNLFGYLGADGTWYAYQDDSPYREIVEQVAFIQYLNFGSKM